ncbi:MAG TPA: DNA primase [Longimicrobiales bacterium]|nr:DNA primase [Longimicrobiales bacterium]
MIPETIIDEIRIRADIVDVVSEQLPLKRAGREFKALCPFHHEKTPSFYVVPQKGFYKCFGCGESGDVFSFLMKRGGLSFQDAARELANKVGIEIPDPRLGQEQEEPHRLLYEAVAFADDWFRRNLQDEKLGAKARRYLAERDIPEAAVERFGIGYAPEGWRVLREAAHAHGIEDDVLLAAGLIKESDRGDDPYDRFRDRLIFPVAELGGRVIAFGGRLLGRSENAPKYLNSPETPIYHKGDLLYGLNWSRGAIRREGSALMVEGYMDYVALAGRGVENVVAGMGTALTQKQANLLARYTGKVLLLYDSDAAGLKATFKTADVLLHTGVHPLVVSLPTGEDPDSVVRKGGAAALKPFLDDAKDVVERKVQMLEERGFFNDIEGVRRALDRLLPTLRATVDPQLRDIYTARIAQKTGVRRETLERDVERTPEPQFDTPRVRVEQPARKSAGPREYWSSERLLLMVLLTDQARVEQARALVPVEDLKEPRHREIYHALLVREGDADLKLSNSAAALKDELLGRAAEVVDAERSFESAVADLQLDVLTVRLKYLDDRIHGAREEDRGALTMEKYEIAQQKRSLEKSGRLGFKASRRYRETLGNRRQVTNPQTPE